MATVARDEDTLDPERISAREMRVVFDAAFALMVVNFADRHIVVATFPQLQAEWGASDTQLHRLAERYGSGRVFLAGDAVYTVFLVYAPGWSSCCSATRRAPCCSSWRAASAISRCTRGRARPSRRGRRCRRRGRRRAGDGSDFDLGAVR
jgi:hypothetical protein